MDSKWNNASMQVVVGALAAVVVILGINVMVKAAIAPMSGQMQDVVRLQKDIKENLVKGTAADVQAILRRLAVLENEVRVLKERPVQVGNADNAAQEAQAAEAARLEAAQALVVHDIPVDGTPILGKADAPITITVFNDFQCSYCSRFYPSATAMVKAYPDKVRLVLKHYPLGFHPNAGPAAKAAMAAGVQGKFYEMTDLLFANNRDLTEATFVKLAGELKLNVAKFTKDLKDKDAEWQKKIQADMDLAEKIGVRGTPTYYLNGKTSSARSPEQWKQAIDAILSGTGK